MSDLLQSLFGELSGAVFDDEMVRDTGGVPVSIEEFVTSKDFLGLKGLSDDQYSLALAMSQIYRKDTLLMMYGGDEEAADRRWRQTCKEVVMQLGKGSLTLDTELYDSSTGHWLPMAELQAVDTRVASVTDGGQVLSEYATEVFKSCDAETYEVTTQKGFKVKVNMGHKFVTPGFELTPLCEIPVGGKIAIPAGLPIDNPVRIDDREVKLLGYWLGDGMMPLDEPRLRVINVDFSENDVNAMNEYVDILHSYGDKPNVKKHPTKKMWFVRGGIETCPAILAIAKKHGLWGKRAHTKEIPDAVWSLPDDQLEIFMSRLWGTDGTTYMKKSKGTAYPALEYCSVSEALATGIQRLLMRLGIIASIRSRFPTYIYKGEKKTGREAWYLTITDGEGFLRFHNRISMMDKSTESGAGIVKSKKTNSRYESNVYWDKIKSVKEVGTEELFTVTAPVYSNFVAGGVLNGNSGK